MPDNMSPERQALLRAYGAELHLTPARQVMQGAVDAANTIAERTANAFMPRQFSNPMNPEVHRRTTGPEILAQLAGRTPDALVAGVGTGGTITGVGLALRERFPDLALIAVEPQASAVLSGGQPGPHMIQGIGPGFVPEILRRDIITSVRQVSERDAQRTKTALARSEGLLLGISSGAAVKVALDVARELGPRKVVVTILPDGGERYVSASDPEN